MAIGNPIRSARTALLAKEETTYRTDSTPTANNDLMRVSDVTLNPLNAEPIDRNFIRGGYGAPPVLITGGSAEVSFSVELAGVGGDGTTLQTPAFGPLLKACSMSETVTPASSSEAARTVYQTQSIPPSNLAQSVTLYVYMEGAVHKIIGARGTFTIAVSRDNVPAMAFTMTGIYVAPLTAQTFPNISFAGFGTPIAYTPFNDTLAGVVNAVYSLDIDLGNVVTYRSLIGGSADDVIITDRSVGLSYTAELPATGLPTESIRQGTISSLTLTHGTEPGNQVILAFPRVQISEATIGDEEGARTQVVTARALGSETQVDGDFSMTFMGTTTS